MSERSLRSDGRFLTGMFFKVLPAQIILLLLTGINNIVDGLVGTNFIGPEASGIIGLYAPFQTIWIGLGTVLVVGSQVLCARYMGSGDLQKTKGVFTLNILMTTSILAVATVLSLALPSPISNLLGASPATADALAGYISGRGIGLLPMILASQFVAFLSLEGKDKINYMATGLMIVVNVGMDLFFVTVFRDMGVQGLGIATSISQWAYMAATGWIFWTPKTSLSFSLKNVPWKEAWNILKVGFPSALSLFLLAVRSNIFNKLLRDYDPTMLSVAAIASYNMLGMIFESVGKGLAATGRLMSSLSYGEEDGKALTQIMKTVFTKGFVLLLLACAAAFLLAEPAASLFYADPASPAHQLTALAMRFAPAVLFLQAIYYVFHDYLQSIGRHFIVNLLSALEGIGVMLPIGLALIPAYGIRGSMLTLIISYAILALIGPVYAVIYWKRKPRTLSEWFTVPANFGAPENECLDATIRSLEEAVQVSGKVGSFCRERGVDEKKAYYASLAIEELCLGIIKDRFDEKKKKQMIELRVIHKGEDVFISVKDNCRALGVKNRAELINPQDDSPRSISIRTFMGIVKETEYQMSLGINVFTATV